MSKDKTPKSNETRKIEGQNPAGKSAEPTFGFPGEGSFPSNGDGREFQGGFDVMPHGGSHQTLPTDQIAQLNAEEKIEIGQAGNKDKDKEEKENADEQSAQGKSADNEEKPEGDAASQNPGDYSQSSGSNAQAQDGSLLSKLSLSSFSLEDINFKELSPVTIGLGVLGAGLIFSGGGSGPSDTTAPSVDTVDVSTDNQTITIAYDETLSSTGVPEASSFAISQAGSALQVSSITIQGNSVVLQIGSTISEDPIQISYSGTELTDAAGNTAENFAQLIVSDGYIRGAKIYRDLNDNGVADEGELIEGAVSNDKGEVLLEGESLTYNLIIDGGVNTDTGAKNELALKAPKGFTVINPLTTLVSKIIEDSPSTEPVNIEQSAAKVASSLGLDLKSGETLANYDPVSDSSNNALANQVVTAKIATVLAVASASANNANSAKAAQETVLKNLVDKIEVGNVVLDTNTVETLLKDQQGNSIVSNEKLDKVNASVSKFDQANSIADIVEAQAEVIDDVASAAPSIEVDAASDTGVAGDKSTSDTTPSLKVSFETAALDGTAVVVGDLVEVIATSSEGNQTVGSKTLTQADVRKGFVEIDASSLAEGSFGFAAQVTDIAGNTSAASASATLLIDTSNPSFSSSTKSNIEENIGANKVVYQASASDASNLTFSLAAGSDTALSIDASSGAVSLSTDPDYETQSSYSFTVVATDGAGNKSEQAVSLTITNLDDTAPTITSAATAPAITENSGADQVVYTAIADDSSDISDGVTFSLAAGSDAALSIDASSGAVSLSTDPDYETQSSYSFTVVATDGAGNKSEKAVSLGITNLDDTAPTITSAATATAIAENSGADQVVYTATADDSSDVSDGVTFSLAAGSDAALSIDASSGAVSLSTDPDYETQSSYSFTVVATDGAGNKSEKAVSLGITNLDEVAPSITSSATATAITENSGADQVVYTAIADDSSDVSDGVTFSLAAGSDAALSIDASSGAVSLSTNPDYETQSSYSFTVVATDGAGNEDQQAVSLTITNLDDTAPTITSAATAPAIAENSGADQVVYTAIADDSSDVSDGVTFSLAAGSDAALSIDASSGAVSLSTDPDYETQSSYSFTVVATDGAGNKSEKAVSLGITNLDEVAPTITSAATGLVAEDSGANRPVYTVTTDDSSDISDGVTYSLAAGSDPALSINSDTGVVTLADNPKKDVQDTYNFTVVSEDAAGNSSQLAVTLTVDIAPLITSPLTSSVDENIGANSVVYTAIAEDAGDPNAVITYGLASNSDAALSIDASSGAVSLSTDPDYETQSSYSFTVTAADEAGNTGQQTVSLSINNLDEVAPSITSSATATAIAENSGADQVVYTAIADDSSDVSDGVTFSLAAGSDAALSIDASSGAVSLSTDPDYETQSSYSFTVVATDGAGNKSEKAVSLGITNLDDTAPTITSAATAPAIAENSGADQVVYTAIADDSSDVSDGVTFSLAAGSDTALSIDASSGAVSLSTDPDYETQSSYSFTVVATDGAGNKSEKAVSLGITNLDEVAPSITSSATATAIAENSGADQVVYTAIADDSSDISDGVTFSLAAGSDAALSIDASSGAVSLSTNPDYETQSSYSFTVVATDGAGNEDQQAVSLTITNLDDTAPTITSAATAPAIAENSGADQVVYTAIADDSSDVSDGVTFSLAAVNETIVVTVANKTSGHPEFGNGSSKGYFLDGVESPALNLLPGTYIFDQSDSSNATHAINFYATANKTGSLPAGISVTQTGTAGSAGANTQITITDDFDGSIYYQCVNHPYMGNSLSDSGLSINGSSGQVVLSTNPDYEAQSTYDFTVVATDGSGNKDEQSVTFGITNLDEVAPTFTSSANGDVLGFQSKLYSGSASDSSDISGGITYSLKSNVGDEQLLNVNNSNGEVSLKSGVTNASTKASYDFTLVADDGVNNPAELAVSVDVDPSVSVSGPGVVTQGGIVPILTSDGNGNLMISLKLDPSVSSNYASGIENVDLKVVYDSDQIGVIGTSDLSFPSNVFATPNPTDGQIIAGWITLTPVAADAALVEFTFPDPNIDAAISIDIKEINVGNDALADASYQLGDPVSVSGTSADEVFELAGGNATVSGGGGDDVFVLSSSTGSETSISDFLTGSDILEMASLAIENGYTSAATPGSQAQDQTLVKLIDTQNDIADLVSNSDASLDNSFGAFFDSSSAELTVFIDGDSDANSANIDAYKITLTGNSAFDLDDLNLASPVIPA